MREELDRHFNELFFSWTPYLYQELASVDEEQERALIETGAIKAMGFRYVGERDGHEADASKARGAPPGQV
jgi:deoxyxylulose-5-phosphate synthase